MKKFTKIKKDTPVSPKDNQFIINYKDWNMINDKDIVVILPYFKDDGFILLRNEYVPTYNYKLKDKSEYRNVYNYLTVIKSEIEENKDYIQTVRDTLGKDCGIVLNSNFSIPLDRILFKTNKNLGQYYISLLEINYNDYRQVTQKVNDENNNVIKMNLTELDILKSYDLITEYMLLKLKYDFNIK
jgi:hypothetical protein